jgi:hypothetical protein
MATLRDFETQPRGSANGWARPPGNGDSSGDSLRGGGDSSGDSLRGGGGLRHYAMHDDDRETTRYLSAATQISTDYARLVVSRIIHEPYRALAPAHGADVEVVTRWAINSLRRQIWRDALLTGTLFCGIVLCWVLYAFVPQHMWILVATLIVLALAFTVVSCEHWARWYNILAEKMLRDSFEPSEAPAPANPKMNHRLREVADRRNGNVVVFREGRAFAGSGACLGREQVVIDVSHGKKDADGKEEKPQTFDNSDIHNAILAAIRELNPELKDLHAEQRLFVNGRHVQGNGEIQEDPLMPPYSSVGSDLLGRAADQAVPDARTYVCAEIYGWQGELMVTMFARAVHTGGWLHIEWSFYALPPISEKYMAVDYLYHESIPQRLRETFTWSLARTLPALIWAPFAFIRAAAWNLKWKLHEAGQGHRIRNGQLFDYGAMPSLREEACDLWSMHHYFLDRDEIMYVLLLQNSLIRGMEKFLDDYNIDRGEFKAQAKVIVDASYKNYNIHVGGKISNSSISVGENAQSGRAKKPGGG